MDKNTDKATKVEKEKKSIFKQIEEQQEKLKKLQAKKEKKIKKKITDTFLFLTEEENFIKFEKIFWPHLGHVNIHRQGIKSMPQQ